MYNIDEVNSDISFEVNGKQVAFKLKKSSFNGEPYSPIYLIRTGDLTEPTDDNTYSAKKIISLIGALGNSDNKLDKAIWDKAFDIDAEGNIIAKQNLYGLKGISAYGKATGGEAGTSGGLIKTVYGYEDLSRVFVDTNYTDTFNAYTIAKLAESISNHNHTIADVIGLQTILDSKVDASMLPTSAEKSNWNTAYNFVCSITGADTDTIINKWAEVVDFLNGIDSSNTLQGLINNINDAVSSETTRATNAETALGNRIDGIHTHSNKSVIDGITSTLVSNWNTAYTNSHTHSNKSVLDGITSALITNWNDANSKKHTHSNISALDLITLDADGNIKIDANVYSTGGLSAYGKNSSSGGGSGTIQTVYGYSDINGVFSDSSFDDTFNAYTIAKLASRIASVESGALTSVDWSIINGRPTALSFFTNDCGFITSSALPTKTSQLTNDSGFLTSHQSLSGYATQSWVNANFNNYSLPTATASALGGIKVGTGLGISSSILSVSYGTAAGTACQGNDSRLSNSRPASDVYSWAKASSKPSYTYSEVGAAAASHTHSYLPLSGGTLSGPLVISSSVNNNYNEGLRITKASNNWAGITFGSTGAAGAPTGGWFAALNPSGQFIISPENSTNTTGLTLNKNGNLLWRNEAVVLTTDSRLSNSRPASDVYTWAKAATKPSYTKSEIGLGNVDNTADANKSVNYATSASYLNYTGASSSCFSVAQTSDSFMGTSGWATYLIGNHGNGNTYYSQTIRLPFWGVPQYRRLEGGVDKGWQTFITTENISSQSVSYATSAGSAPASDVYSWAKASSKPSYTKSEVGLGNVDNTSDANKSVRYAASAGAVAWGNVTSKPGVLDKLSLDANGNIKIAGNVYATGGVSAYADGLQTGATIGWADISNKPTTLSGYGITDAVSSSDSRLTNARPASDVYSWAKASVKPTYTASEVGAAAAGHTHSGYASLIASSYSSSSWYRKWDDGWLECGGYVYVAEDATVTINNPCSGGFASTTYFCLATKRTQSKSTQYLNGCVIAPSSRTAISIKVQDYAGNWNWYACGKWK